MLLVPTSINGIEMRKKLFNYKNLILYTKHKKYRNMIKISIQMEEAVACVKIFFY